MVRLRERGIPDDPMPLLPEEGFEFWISVIKDRVVRNYDAVILITGAVGSSKSTCGLRLGQALDRKFTAHNLCYSAESLMNAYRTVSPGEVVLFDEGVRGLMAGDQATVEQKALVQALALVREKGAILIICAPSIWLIAKQIRQGRAYMWIQVVKRGAGLVHTRNEQIRYVPDNTLGFNRSGRAPYMLWEKYKPHAPLWRAYLREKKQQLDDYLKDTEAMLAKRAGHGPPKGGRAMPPPPKETDLKDPTPPPEDLAVISRATGPSSSSDPPSKSKFDKTAYQRDLMRRRRADAKALEVGTRRTPAPPIHPAADPTDSGAANDPDHLAEESPNTANMTDAGGSDTDSQESRVGSSDEA